MKTIFLLSSILFILSCSSKHKIPAEIIQPTQMEAVIWDLLKADEFVANYGRKDSTHSFKDKSTFLYEEVFRIHKTDKAQFEKSISFYKLHPDLFKIVIDSLEKKKTAFLREGYKPSMLSDSFRTKMSDSFRLKMKHPVTK